MRLSLLPNPLPRAHVREMSGRARGEGMPATGTGMAAMAAAALLRPALLSLFAVPFRAIFFSFFPHSQFLSPLLLRALIENVKKGSFSAASAEINGPLLEKSSRNLQARHAQKEGREERARDAPSSEQRAASKQRAPNAEEGARETRCRRWRRRRRWLLQQRRQREHCCTSIVSLDGGVSGSGQAGRERDCQPGPARLAASDHASQSGECCVRERAREKRDRGREEGSRAASGECVMGVQFVKFMRVIYF